MTRFVACLAVACACALAVPPVFAARPLPDLVVTSIAGVPASGLGGTTISVRDTVVNRGKTAARRSAVVYYLSLDGRLDAKDIRLEGGRTVAPLRARKAARGKSLVRLPTNVTGLFELIACADGSGKMRESREANNCRTAARAINVYLPRP